MSQPHGPTEQAHTPLEAPPQSSKPFATPLLHYSPLRSTEHCTFLFIVGIDRGLGNPLGVGGRGT